VLTYVLGEVTITALLSITPSYHRLLTINSVLDFSFLQATTKVHAPSWQGP
jgi:hypothetical protein